MVFNVCVLLELSDSVYVGVVTACVVRVHAKMCVVQRNCNSLPILRRLQRIGIHCRNWVICSEFVIRCRNWVFCSELAFAAELCVVQRNCNSLPILRRLQRIGIHCRNWVICSEFVIRCRNWVFCGELAFAAELCVVQRNYDSLPKLCRLQQISIRCRHWVVCSEFVIRCRNWVFGSELAFAAETELSAANLW
jgi:hypothetical protein